MARFNYEKNMIKNCNQWEKLDELKSNTRDKFLINSEYQKWLKKYDNQELELSVIFIKSMIENDIQNNGQFKNIKDVENLKITLGTYTAYINNSKLSLVDFMQDQDWKFKEISPTMKLTDRLNKSDKNHNQLEMIEVLVSGIIEHEDPQNLKEFLESLDNLQKEYNNYKMPLPHFILNYYS